MAGTSPLYSQNAEQLYQKALMKEEGEGNLPEAIEIFNSIVEDSNAEDALQAKALLHVGLCYEKMGKEEATKAYQRLVNNFPGQKNEVAIARERLSKLILAVEKLTGKDIEEKHTLTNKKIWDEHDTDLEGAVSPDGKYLSYVDWDTGDLALYEIATGKKRRITNKGSWEKSPSYCEYSRWFPDSKRIIYLWYNEEEGIAELRTINIDNPKPKILIKDKEMVWAEIYDCSSDGKYVLACLERKNDEGILTLISLNDGSERALRPHYSNAAFSNDQRYVIYDLPQKADKGNKDIYIMDLDTKKETKLIEHSGDDRFVGRVPNTNDILFISDRTGTPDFWLIKVQNGKRLGEAELVKSNKGPFPPVSLGFTNDGAFYYGQQRNDINIYETEIEPTTGEIITAPKRIIQSYIGANGCPDYSPDGKYLAYVSRRPPGTMRFTTNPVGNILCIRSLETKEEKEFRPNINEFGFIRWSPDGNSVMVVSFDVDGNYGYYQIDTHTGILKPFLIPNNRDLFGGHGWLPNGNTFFYGLRDSVTREFQVILQNLKSGKKEVAYHSSNQFGISASPDGTFLSILSGSEKSLKILPVSGGETKELFKPEEVKNSEFEIRGVAIAWSSDGKYIYFSMRNSGDDNSEWELCRISIANRKIDRLGIKTNNLSHFANLNAHPDGKHFSYSSRDKLNSEVWKLENFLPSENQETAAKEPEGIKIRQIWKAPYLDDLGTVTLDGKYRSYVDWGFGNVGIHNLITDEKKVLTNDAKLGEAWQFAGGTVISGDGKRIVYSWANPYNTNALCLIHVENPKPVLLYKKTGEELYPSAWLSDKEIVAFRSIPDTRTMQLVTFNIMDKKIKVKKTFLPGQFGGAVACSPDKKYIAYGFANSADKGNTEIRLLEANGDRDIPLITHPSNDKVLGWVPGRKEFLFISDRSGSWDLWAIKLDDTKPLGSAKRIYADIGEVSPMGFTRDGECYFGFSRRNFYSGLAPFNKETGVIDLGTGKSFESQNFLITWSPNGQYLAYIEIEDNSKGNPFKLFVQDVKSGEKFQPDNNTLRVSSYKWSPDGKSILVIGREIDKLQEKDYKGGIFVVDIETGQIDQVLLLSEYEFNRPEDDSAPLSCVEWSPDKRNAYYLFQKDRLVTHNLETGKDEIIYKFSDFSPYILETSPDGKNLLFGLEYPGEEKSSLFTMPAEGGNEKVVCTSQEAKRIIWAKYSPDGREIYFVELPEFDKSVLWRVPAEGGKPEKIWSPGKRVEIYDIHPDGNRVAFSIRERTTEVRVIENLSNELEKIYSQNE